MIKYDFWYDLKTVLSIKYNKNKFKWNNRWIKLKYKKINDFMEIFVTI